MSIRGFVRALCAGHAGVRAHNRSGQAADADLRVLRAAPAAAPNLAEPLERRVLLSGSATFVRADDATAGDWLTAGPGGDRAYGTEGYALVNGPSQVPSYVTGPTVAGGTQFLWSDQVSPAETRALAVPGNASDGPRLAACWYSESGFDVDLSFTDGQAHQVAFYLLDYDQWNARGESVSVTDADSGATLDAPRSQTGFFWGRYLVYTMSGHVDVHFDHTAGAGSNAVLSGIFFDTQYAPSPSTLPYAPVGTIAGSPATIQGEPYTLDLSATSYNGSGEISHWTIDWGDGSDPDADGAVGELLAGNPSTATHAYAGASPAGGWRVTGTVTDAAGASAPVALALDGSFAAGGSSPGTALGPAGTSGFARAVATDPATGRVAVAGNASPTVMVYAADGAPDPTFTWPSLPNFVDALAFDSQGRLVTAGLTGDNFEVRRFLADGSPDTSFSGDGVIATDFGGYDLAYAMAVGPDDSVTVAGAVNGGSLTGDANFALARYTPSGLPDATFGQDYDGDGQKDGKTDLDLGASDSVRDLTLLPSGKLLAAGYASSQWVVARLNADGTKDTTFGAGDGVTYLDPTMLNDAAHGVDLDTEILSSGKILLAGSAESKVALARLNADGTIDSAYGAGGVKVTPWWTGWEQPVRLRMDAAGRPVLAFNRYDRNPAAGGPSHLAAARLNANGTPDATFGATGVVDLPWLGADQYGITWPGLALSADKSAAFVSGTEEGAQSMTASGLLEGNTVFVEGNLSLTPVDGAADEGAVYNDPVGNFTEQQPGTVPGDYAATLAWADGTQTTGVVSDDGTAGRFVVSAGNKQLGEEGSIGATVTVTHVTSGSSVNGTFTVSIEDAPLDVVAADVQPARAEEFSGAVATFTDPFVGAPVTDFAATIDWGDGSQSAGTVTGAGGTFSVSGDHTFDWAGEVAVTVYVSDIGGADGYTIDDVTIAESAPDAPDDLTATKVDDAGEIDLAWTPVEFATGYDVYRSDGGGTTATKVGSVGEAVGFYDDADDGNDANGPGLAGHTAYTYTVRATNDAGDSEDSNTASATTDDNAPVAVDDRAPDASADTPYVVVHNATLDIPVLANDSDVDGDTLSITSPTVVSGGGSVQAATASGSGPVLRYTPGSDTGESWDAQLTYNVNDGTMDSAAPATVDVKVVDDFPKAFSDHFLLESDTPANAWRPLPIQGQANGSDGEGDALTFTVVTQPQHGTLSMNASTGEFTYTPSGADGGHAASDFAVFKVNDGHADSNYATLSFDGWTFSNFDEENGERNNPAEHEPDGDENIQPVESINAPNGQITVLTGQEWDGTLADAANDPNGATPYIVNQDPGNPAAAGHSVSLGSDGSLMYSAPDGFSGTDWFTYYLVGQQGGRSNYATIYVDVQPVRAALTWGDQPAPADPAFNETLVVNDDYDNDDGVPDNTEPEPPANDPDLVPLALHTSPAVLPDGSTLTLSLASGSDDVRVWLPDGSGGYEQILGNGSSTSKTWTVDSSDYEPPPASVLVEGYAAGDTQLALAAAVPPKVTPGPQQPPQGPPKQVANGPAKANIADPKLGVFYTAPDQNVTEVTPDAKGVEKAFIPLNWDNDNYAVDDTLEGDSQKNAIGGKRPVPDFQKSADGVKGVAGEDDLVRLVFHNLSPHTGQGEGKFKIGGPGIKTNGNDRYLAFFENYDKTGHLDLRKMTFDAAAGTDYFVWVEAREFSVTQNLFTLSITGPRPANARPNAVNLEVFEFKGPQNVPGNTEYAYSVRGRNDLNPVASMWSADNGATVTAHASQLADGGSGYGVLFDDGAKIENVYFAPAAGFRYSLPINVVKVEFAKHNNIDQVTLNRDGPTQKLGDLDNNGANNNGRVHINAAGAGVAMRAQVDVTLTGPIQPWTHQMAGIRFIDVGFMQTGSVTSREYTSGGRRYVAYDAASRVHAGTYPMLDALNNPDVKGKEEAENERPWYDSNKGGLLRGAYKVDYWPVRPKKGESNASVGDAMVPATETIETTDTPFSQSTSVDKAATKNELQLDFTVYLAVHTIDNVNGALDLYYDRGEAKWTFNGSGNLKQGVWSRTAKTGNYSGNPGVQATNFAPSPAGTLVLGNPLYRRTLILNESLNQRIGQKNNDTLDHNDADVWKPQ